MTRDSRTKLDPKADLCRFVGYPQRYKGYEVYHLASKRIIVCRDVEFLENTGRSLYADADNDTQVWNYETLRRADDEGTENVSPSVPSADEEHASETDEEGEEEREAMPLERSEGSSQLNEKGEVERKEEAEEAEKRNKTEKSSTMDTGSVEPETIRETARRTGELNVKVRETAKRTGELNVKRRTRMTRRDDIGDEAVALLAEGFIMTAEALKDDENNDTPSIQAARVGPRWEKWEKAIELEHQSLVENQVYEEVRRPWNARIIKSGIILKVKRDAEGNIATHKARVIAKGYSQVYGIDYMETYAPVARRESLRLMIAIAVQWELCVHQMDVNTAFLYAKLEEEVYLEAPDELKPRMRMKDGVWKLKRCLYGLKQSPKGWNDEIDATLKQMGFYKSKVDPCVYVLWNEEVNKPVLLALYVDDLLLAAENVNVMEKVKYALKSRYKMKDLGVAQWCLGMKLTWNLEERWVNIDQGRFVREILKRFDMMDSKAAVTPMEKDGKEWRYPDENMKELDQIYPYREAVGCLNYLSSNTRPDITFVTSWLGKFVESPGEIHWKALKRVLRYLRGTEDQGVRYRGAQCGDMQWLDIRTLSDADWSGDLVSGRSTSGVVSMVSQGAVMWTTKRQNSTAQSTAEAEYMALGMAVQDILWMKKWLMEVGVRLVSPIPLFCDNTAAVAMSRNLISRRANRHIRVQISSGERECSG
jgi:hypothetical protein